ncbi:MAG TPA: GTPase HflX, partial [Flavobacteriales bacterium]|nr:GTPase HflX [Flavobacteriales bacterium]
MAEKAVLIGLITPNITLELVEEYLLELDFLARTAGAKTVKQFTQKLPHADNATFLGKGKTEEVRQYVEENEIDIVIFDDELSPSQLRNVEKIYNCKILDRNN